MNKITRKKYRINANAFVGVEQEIVAYAFFCKCIYSLKQMSKRFRKKNHLVRIKIKHDFKPREEK